MRCRLFERRKRLDESPSANSWTLGDYNIWGFPQIRDTFLGVPIIRIIVFWGLYLGSPCFGKLPFLPVTVRYEGFSKLGLSGVPVHRPMTLGYVREIPITPLEFHIHTLYRALMLNRKGIIVFLQWQHGIIELPAPHPMLFESEVDPEQATHKPLTPRDSQDPHYLVPHYPSRPK